MNDDDGGACAEDDLPLDRFEIALQDGLRFLREVFPQLEPDAPVDETIDRARWLLIRSAVALEQLLLCPETAAQATRVTFDAADAFCSVLDTERAEKSPHLKDIAAERDSTPMLVRGGARRITGGDPSVKEFLEWVGVGKGLYPNPALAKRGDDRTCQEAAEWILGSARCVREFFRPGEDWTPAHFLARSLARSAEQDYLRFLDVIRPQDWEQLSVLGTSLLRLPEPAIPLTDRECLRAWQDWVCGVAEVLFTAKPEMVYPKLFEAKVKNTKPSAESNVRRVTSDLIRDAIRKAVASAFRFGARPH